METNYSSEKTYVALREDRQMLMLLHLSQLLNTVTGLGGLIAAIVIWQIKKGEIAHMDEQGKEVVNFQISLILYAMLSVVLVIILVGIFTAIAVGLISIIFPIIYGIQAKDGKHPIRYPLTIRFIQ